MPLTLLVVSVPVLLGTVVLVALRWPAARAMPVCGGATRVLLLTCWGVPFARAAARAEAAAVTVSVLLERVRQAGQGRRALGVRRAPVRRR